jgi:glycosyltransferase 2 family protein
MTELDAPQSRRARKFELIRLIGPLILIILLANIDLGHLWALLSTLTTIQVAGAGAAVLGLLLARCERWHRLLSAAGLELDRRSTYASCLQAIWIGYITPGRIGEFKRGLDLARWQITTPGTSGALVLIDLSADAAMAMAIVAVALLTAYVTAAPIIMFVGGFWISALIAIGMAMAMRPMLSALSFVSSKIRYFSTLTDLLDRLSRVPQRTLLLLFCLTIISNAFYVAQMIPLFRPIDMTITLSNAVVMVMIAAVAGMLPITYFGLGTREAALLFVLAQTDRSSELAIALSLTFVVGMAIGFFVAVALDVLLWTLRRFKGVKKM